MPTTIRSYVVANEDCSFTVVLNSKLSHERNLTSFKHELEHILSEDYNRNIDVDVLEFNAHNVRNVTEMAERYC